MDEDGLDRMLAALPLEESPATLRARIMAATVDAPPLAAVAPAAAPWEIAAIGVVAALAVWLTWIVLTIPGAAERAAGTLASALGAGGVASPMTLVWVGIGASAAFWVSQLTVPAAATARIRAR